MSKNKNLNKSNININLHNVPFNIGILSSSNETHSSFFLFMRRSSLSKYQLILINLSNYSKGI
jgi:hypothetical protein